MICHNSLHVPSLEHDLIRPLIIRETGLFGNDTSKIHVLEPSVEDHSIYFKDTKVRITLSLSGIFSYFTTRTPSVKDMCDEGDVLHLTPNVLTWNPHGEAYLENEENMLDFQGSVIEPKDRIRVLISDLEENDNMIAKATTRSVETVLIDKCVINTEEPSSDPSDYEIKEVSATFDTPSLSKLLQDGANVGKFAMTIGATDIHEDRYLFNDPKIPDVPNTDDILDEIMVSVTHAAPKKGVDAFDLSKVWKIDPETAQRTLDVTTQHQRCKDDPSLSRNYKTSDCMLR